MKIFNLILIAPTKYKVIKIKTDIDLYRVNRSFESNGWTCDVLGMAIETLDFFCPFSTFSGVPGLRLFPTK